MINADIAKHFNGRLEADKICKFIHNCDVLDIAKDMRNADVSIVCDVCVR